MTHPAADGAALAAALLARAAWNDTASTWELVGEVVQGDAARETLVALGLLAGGLAAAVADLRCVPLATVLDDVARVASEAVTTIGEEA